MTKQIDREKLLARLRNGLSMGNPDMSIQLLVDRIESGDFDAPESAGWINVKDKLPDSTSGEVLICFLEPFFGEMIPEIAVGYYDHPDNYDQSSDANGWCFNLTNNQVKGGGVTHWMPLPPAPEEE